MLLKNESDFDEDLGNLREILITTNDPSKNAIIRSQNRSF